MNFIKNYFQNYPFQMIPRTKFEEELQARQLNSFGARMKLMDVIISTKTERKAKNEGTPFLIDLKEDITSNKNQVSLFFDTLKVEK